MHPQPSRVKPNPGTNRLLAALDSVAYNRLTADATVVNLELNRHLYRQDDPIDSVLFPLDSMVSLLAGTSRPDLVETATIGSEGVVGASELLQDQPSMGVYLIQLPGAALSIDAASFRRSLDAIPGLRTLVERHFYALARQIMQSAACNRLHTSGHRAARWLLMTHDRAGSDTFPMTQEFLSSMLAVRRATVNASLTGLRDLGLIRYSRGHVTVMDREGLQSAACNCYSSVWKPYLSLNESTRQL